MIRALTNTVQLEKMRDDAPLVQGDEKIAVFGAGGQIGSKLRPVLEKLYPGRVIYCEAGPTAKERGFTPLDVTDTNAIRRLIRENNVKVIINLAALLSKAAQDNPELAYKINVRAPIDLLEIARQEGVRKVQMMSSMASQEFDAHRYDSEEVTHAKQALRDNAPTSLHAVPQGSYGLAKSVMENLGRLYSLHYDLDVNLPRLAGVLNAHTPWPSEGTTEELDKLVVAAAMQKVYGDQWQNKMREAILAREPEKGPKQLAAEHYIRDGQYVPEVSADTTFDMVDGRTLADAVLMLLHKDLTGQQGIQHTDVVQNVSEYSVSMQEAVGILKKINPDFKVTFAVGNDGLDRDKMINARIWPTRQDTTSTEALIGPFKERTAEESIRAAYTRAVEAFQREKRRDSSVKVSERDTGGNIRRA